MKTYECYLVHSSVNGEHYADLMTMHQLAQLIGFNDCNDTTVTAVYRLNHRKKPESLEVVKHHRELSVDLYDMWGNLVDSGYYPDH